MITSSAGRFLPITIGTFGLFLASHVGRPAAAAGSSAPGGGSSAGPIELTTEAEVVSTPLGSLLETTLVVENHGPDPVTVFLLGKVEWPAGSRQLLRYGRPVTIDGDGAFVLSALSAIPDDAGSGAGTFTATAFVGAIGQGGRGNYPGRLIARSSAPFEL
jgi:hypothetical protein